MINVVDVTKQFKLYAKDQHAKYRRWVTVHCDKFNNLSLGINDRLPDTISFISRTYSKSPCSFFGLTYVSKKSLNFLAMKRRTSSLVTHSLSVPWTRYISYSLSSPYSSYNQSILVNCQMTLTMYLQDRKLKKVKMYFISLILCLISHWYILSWVPSLWPYRWTLYPINIIIASWRPEISSSPFWGPIAVIVCICNIRVKVKTRRFACRDKHVKYWKTLYLIERPLRKQEQIYTWAISYALMLQSSKRSIL